MNLLADPRLFNYCLMALNLGAAIRWAWAGQWTDALYWTCAFGLNLCITVR